MPWPSTIVEQFDLSSRYITTNETEYYGAYVSLLTHLFPHTENFQVIPQVIPPSVPGSVAYSILYVVKKRNTPVFFLQIKPFSHLHKQSTRAEADEQMRKMFRDLSNVSNLSRLERLYGVSALGTTFSVYQYTKSSRTLTPDVHRLADTAPAERWNYQLLEREGEAKFNSIVNEVKTLASVI